MDGPASVEVETAKGDGGCAVPVPRRSGGLPMEWISLREYEEREQEREMMREDWFMRFMPL